MKLPRVQELLLNVALQPRHLAKSLSRWMPTVASQTATVMVLDGHWVKLLQAEGPSHARRISRIFAAPVAESNPEELKNTFQEACRAGGLIPGEVLIATPTHLCTLRFFSLPSTDPKEVRDMVELQVEKHTHYAKEEILTDFKIIDRERSGYSRVLLTIAHQEVVHRAVRLVESSGLLLDRVGCELEGLINWFLLVTRGTEASASAPSLVVDVDGSTTTLLTMQHGQPYFHRSLASGVEELQQDPASASDRLVKELHRSIEAMESEGGMAKPQRIVLTGRSERLGELKDVIEKGLSLPVSVLSPWAQQELSESARVTAERLADVSFASLVGLALSPSSLDLTPQATKLHHAFEAKAKALVRLGCQGLGALLLVSLLMISRVHNEYRYYQTLQQLYAHSAQEAFRMEEALRQIEFVKQRLTQRGPLLEAATALAALSPAAIRWESLTYTQGERVVLKGTSTELPKVYEFVASLGSSPLFGHVETKRVAKRKSDEEGLTDFEIHCPFVSATPQATP